MRPTPSQARRRHRHRGFTLVEVIISLTLIGILAAVAVPMLQMPMTAYTESSARARVTTYLDWVQSKLTADFAGALPNSVRVRTAGGRYFIEFLQVHAQGRYRAGTSTPAVTQSCPATASCAGAGLNDALEFGAAPACSDSCFLTLGALPAANIVPGSDYVVVNPTNTLGLSGDPYANAAPPAVQSIRTRLLALTPHAAKYGTQVTMTPNAFPTASSVKRFYVIDASPVTYSCSSGAAGALTRYSGYNITPVQPTAFGAAVTSAALSSLVRCSITGVASVIEPAGVRNRGGLVTIKMTLTVPGVTGSVPEQAELVFTAPVSDG